MNILLLGHKGYLGSYLYDALRFEYWANIVTTDKKNHIPDGNFDYVINCAGYLGLENCQKNPNLSYEANVQLVRNTAQKHSNSKIIHFSSYYVYDNDFLATETDNATHKYWYTFHKLISEDIVNYNGNVVFRLGKLFGHPNRLSNLENYILNTKQPQVDKIQFNPCSLMQVYRFVISELIGKINFQGIYNLANVGIPSHFGFASHLLERKGIKKQINIIDKAPKIFHNYDKCLMDLSKLKNIHHDPLRIWVEDLI